MKRKNKNIIKNKGYLFIDFYLCLLFNFWKILDLNINPVQKRIYAI